MAQRKGNGRISFLRRVLDRVLSPLGYRRAEKPTDYSMDAMLRRAAVRGMTFGTIVDVGAAAGRWTRKCLVHFPKPRFLLVEPLEERRAALERLHAEFPNAEFALAAASEVPGEAVLSVASDLDGSGIYDRPIRANSRTVPVISLDS